MTATASSTSAIHMMPRTTLLRDVLLVALGSLLLAASAQVAVPMYPVPMTMQTCVLLMIAGAYGAPRAIATVALYLAEGAVGLPVFANGGAGVVYMMGPTGGFLAGFLVAATLTGFLFDRGAGRTLPRALAALALGHIVLFVPGVLWLAKFIGFDAAWVKGVVPFVAGTVVKTLLAAALLYVGSRAVTPGTR